MGAGDDSSSSGSISNGTYRITNRNSGTMLDIADSSTEDGANVQQYSWSGVDNQLWTFEPV